MVILTQAIYFWTDTLLAILRRQRPKRPVTINTPPLHGPNRDYALGIETLDDHAFLSSYPTDDRAEDVNIHTKTTSSVQYDASKLTVSRVHFTVALSKGGTVVELVNLCLRTFDDRVHTPA